MKAIFAIFALYPSVVLSAGVSTIRGSQTERNAILQVQASDIVHEAAVLSATLASGAVDHFAEPIMRTLASGTVQASSHVVQWGSAQNGCSYALPPVTISCGAGATIVLGQKAATVTGCSARNSNSLICSSIAPPHTNPQVTVTCFGTTPEQLTATVQVPESQATCSNLLGFFPQSNLAIRGGAASVLAYIGRYCKSSNGALSFNTNFPCGSGTKQMTQGSISFCVAEGACNTRLPCNSTTPEQSCPGSCSDKLAAVTISDQDTSSQCVNAGPRPKPLPAGLHAVTWSSFHQHCSSTPSTITASCGTGGSIALANSGSNAPKCTGVGSSSVRCTLNAGSNSASIVFYCYGVTDAARTASAFLPKSDATNCNTVAANTINVASQAVVMQRFCGNGTLTAHPSNACGNPSQLILNQPNKSPVCISSGECKSSSKSSCAISLDAVSVSDANADPTCTIMGPKSLYF